MTHGAYATGALRVLVDATALPRDRGGVGRYVDELLAALPRLGVQVAVVAQQRDSERYVGLVGHRRVHHAPRWATHPGTRLMWEQTGLPMLMRQLRPDVLLSPHYTAPLANAGPGRAGQVVTLHDLTFFSHPELHKSVKARFFSAWTRVSARRADAVVVPSQATLDELIARVGADRSRCHVIPHGVDQARFHPPSPAQIAAARDWARIPEGRAYLAFLGTLEPRKNVPALVGAYIDACRGRPGPPALVLAGGPGWDARIDSALAEVPPGLTVRRPGFVPEGLVAGLLGGAEVVTYPSLGEGFGLPVLEAMACGAPVLTTRLLSLPEVGGDAVAYAASPSRADIAAALTRLLDDPNRLAELSARGQTRAATYTWEAAARAHVAVFEQVARVGAGRSP